MTSLLECRDIRKQFGAIAASDGVNLSVEAGEFVGVIGANGAGKTTLLNIISGYLKPSKGRIYFRGSDVTGLPPRRLAQLGIARSFQIPQLFHDFTVLDNMMLALGLLARPRSSILSRFSGSDLEPEALRILSDYGISDRADALGSALPQGVRKLLDIAMASCADPKLVLLDEPTSGVSSEEKDLLMGRLSERLKSAGKTVLFIEHDIDIVARYASRVVALYNGSVIADGPPMDVLTDNDVARLIVGTWTAPEGIPSC